MELLEEVYLTVDFPRNGCPVWVTGCSQPWKEHPSCVLQLPAGLGLLGAAGRLELPSLPWLHCAGAPGLILSMLGGSRRLLRDARRLSTARESTVKSVNRRITGFTLRE